ncbi:hypothetical protein IWX49DRAFT_141916 [Phyllosticta citricarpa]|uniref:BTB domain-containing protein n=1 Tax=Phyllosticta citricarpa TaxID=55181 RepID=A0ABR1M7G5_9PEZI
MDHHVNHLNLETSVTNAQPTDSSQHPDAARPHSLFAGPMDPPNNFATASNPVFASEPTPFSFAPSSSLNPSSNPWNSSFDAPRSEGARPVASAEKAVDDPSVPVGYVNRFSHIRPDYDTLAHLSRMFSAPGQPSSRMDSFSHNHSLSANPATTGPLPRHLLDRGLIEGCHSDITIVAFGKSYTLHRLILDQAPFFKSMLTGPWRESRSGQVELHPEEIDTCITEAAFELTIKRLYGGDISQDEDEHCLGLFATACWLDMQDLVEVSIDAILRRMHPDGLAPLIKLVTLQYYGRAGERILASAKAMLCRDGYEMKTSNWDDIPSEIIREIVGGDGFFVYGEYYRWRLAKRIFNSKLWKTAIAMGLVHPEQRKTKAPDMLGLMAIRFDSVYRQNYMTTVSNQGKDPDGQQKWLSLYTHYDIEPLLVLLEEGIHFIHLDFEQLQGIRQTRDVFGLPMVSEKAITNALWMQMELRQRVVTAKSGDLELGLKQRLKRNKANLEASMSASQPGISAAKGKGAAKDDSKMDEDQDMDSGSWDANGKPRKFWIPNNDCNIVVGASAEPMASASLHSNSSRLSATLQPEDVQWANDFSAPPDANRIHTPFRSGSGANARENVPKSQGRPVYYTHFPPFRFAAEFPNPRLLKEKKRVYSRSVFYAGSLWNIYIQKVKTNKGNQLGVYLHRVKESSLDQEAPPESEYEAYHRRIYQESDIIRRQIRRDLRQRERQAELATAMMGVGQPGEEENGSGSSGDGDASSQSRGQSLDLPSLNRARNNQFDDAEIDGAHAGDSSEDEPQFPTEIHTRPWTRAEAFARKHGQDASTSALPQYIDARPTIKTYFKIYSPSKGGRLLSVYESAPDKFNFSQSWGWKSSTLMLDDAASVASTTNNNSSTAPRQQLQSDPDLLVGTVSAADAMDVDGAEAAAGSAVSAEAAQRSISWKEHCIRKKGDGLLRFMIVLGNL